MSNAPYADAALTKIRAIVAVIDHEIVQEAPTPALRAAWAQLVEALALGTAAETRECPACHSIGMRAASRCGHCWATLVPLPPVAAEATPPAKADVPAVVEA